MFLILFTWRVRIKYESIHFMCSIVSTEIVIIVVHKLPQSMSTGRKLDSSFPICSFIMPQKMLQRHLMGAHNIYRGF